ncbi:MAG: hypothetical protein R3C69_01275 [Geminicoccaceae bacterium]
MRRQELDAALAHLVPVGGELLRFAISMVITAACRTRAGGSP